MRAEGGTHMLTVVDPGNSMMQSQSVLQSSCIFKSSVRTSGMVTIPHAKYSPSCSVWHVGLLVNNLVVNYLVVH